MRQLAPIEAALRPKLTVQDVAKIRQQHEYGRKPSVIAKEFGVSRMTVWKIVNERMWKKSSNIT